MLIRSEQIAHRVTIMKMAGFA